MDFILSHIFLITLVIVSGALLFFPNFLSIGKGKSITSKNVVLIMNRQPSFIVDIRNEEDFNLGHIPNAINIPFDEIANKIQTIMKHSKKVCFVYCQRGVRSERAINLLIKSGFKNVLSIEGGINAWISSQLPTISK